jgi:hypothetical protein
LLLKEPAACIASFDWTKPMDSANVLSLDDRVLREEFAFKAINCASDFFHTSWGYGAWQKLQQYESKGLVKKWQPPLAPYAKPDDIAWVLTHGGILWLLQTHKRAQHQALIEQI